MIPAWFVDQDLAFARIELERMKTRLMPEHIHGIGHKQNGCRDCPRGGTPDLEWIPKLKPHWWVLSANIDIWRRQEDERPALLRAGIIRIRRLIGQIRGGLDQLTDHDRTQIDHAIDIVRQHRTATAGMPGIRQPLSVFRPEPTI